MKTKEEYIMRFRCGKHIGMPYEWVVKNDKSYIDWLDNNVLNWGVKFFTVDKVNNKRNNFKKVKRYKNLY